MREFRILTLVWLGDLSTLVFGLAWVFLPPIKIHEISIHLANREIVSHEIQSLNHSETFN